MTLHPVGDLCLSYPDVEDASRLLAGHIVETPLLSHPWLDEAVGGRVLIKPEVLQVAGAFKFRGAYNRIARLTPAERANGVVAWSSGNHAQGVAAAALQLGVHAVVVMPADAPRIKIENTRRYGAEVVLYDRRRESREDIAMAICDERGSTPVPPNDDGHVIAGYGTVGLEMARQAQAMGARFDDVLVCCGGGGLVAGMAIAFANDSPGTRVYAVEPATLDDTARSLAAGSRVSNAPEADSICDALMATIPAAMTYPINAHYLAGAVVVTDDEVRAAMVTAHRLLKLVVEPGGAVALAAALHGKIDCQGKTIGVVLSGGNVDMDLYAQTLSASGEG